MATKIINILLNTDQIIEQTNIDEETIVNNIIIKQDIRQEELKNQQKYEEENDELERKYKRKEGYSLELLISSNQIRKFSNNPQEVAKEIMEKMAIDSIIEATVLSNAEDQILIKIRTSNLDDFITMREHKNWPKTAFGSKNGVYVRTIQSELPLSISDIDKEKVFDPKMIKNLMKQEQINNIERQW